MGRPGVASLWWRSKWAKLCAATVILFLVVYCIFVLTTDSTFAYTPVSVQNLPLVTYGFLTAYSATPEARSFSGATGPKGDQALFDVTMLTNTGEKRMASYRKLRSTISDLRNFLVHHLKPLQDKETTLAILSKSREFLRVMELDAEHIEGADDISHDVEVNMLKLQAYVQLSIHNLQNPKDCRHSPKLRCLLDNPWGFAAGVHDILWCFVAALRMGRTVILDSKKWHYAPDNDWEKTFLPVTGSSCSKDIAIDSNNTLMTGYPGYNSETSDRGLIVDLPSTIIRQLVANHGDPYAWWYGQILSYVLRFQNSTQRRIEEFKRSQGYAHPIVGLHIRQTDKNREAAYHDVEEYMSHAEEFYARLALTKPVSTKRVFVATDEPRVIGQIKSRFPHYEVIFNNHSAMEAHSPEARKKSSALFDMLCDIQLLAESDFLVCTLSSGFCRIAYELMQSRHPDASARVASLDVDYNYAYVAFPPRRTLYTNNPAFKNELGWSRAGSLVAKLDDYDSRTEAKQKKFNDGFTTGSLVGGSKKPNTVFPKFKATQMYKVANYSALPASTAL